MMGQSKRSSLAGAAALMGVAAVAAGGMLTERPAVAAAPQSQLAATCTPQALTGVASSLGMGVTVKQVPNGPQLPGGVKFVPASGKVPAYCQVTGSYVTNPKTGKTANFLATFPEQWNGKYLQLGCSGACGYLLMNNPASPPITITAQGYPGQLIEKGYAIFGNDLGHVLPGPTSMSFDWLRNADGTLNVDALDDYHYRADLVMADMGKAFTRAFFRGDNAAEPKITRSYFSGCSQGGREALIAATQFPEKFDGIIAGSPASDVPGQMWASMAKLSLAQKLAPAKLTPGQVNMLASRVIAQCDGLDGVKDGIIQNPAACQTGPLHDVPICAPGETADTCLSQAQADAVSANFSAVTDDSGKVLQPGMPISDQGYGFVTPIPANMPVDADMHFMVGKGFDGQALSDARAGGPGGISPYHLVLNGEAFRKYFDLSRSGTVMADDFGKFLEGKGKLLWYHNLSDEALTPYMSINRYKRLAQLHGGYARLQEKIRFFAVPASGHCGMGGPGPSNFDAMGALEAWVEQGAAPQALVARAIDPAHENLIAGKVDWSRPSPRTMPLCTFPQMAHYKGNGDVNVAANWECRSSDKRMLTVGAVGHDAGVLR